MHTTPPQRFFVAQILLMLGVLCLLALTGLLRVDLFLILSLVGFVLLREFTSPFSVQPSWRIQLRWIVVVGYAAFITYAIYITYSMIGRL